MPGRYLLLAILAILVAQWVAMAILGSGLWVLPFAFWLGCLANDADREHERERLERQLYAMGLLP